MEEQVHKSESKAEELEKIREKLKNMVLSFSEEEREELLRMIEEGKK